MKKRFAFSVITIASFFLLFSFTSAQASGDWAVHGGSCYAKGDMILDVGIPVLLPFYPWMGVHAAFDYGFHDAISGGGGIGFRVNDFHPIYLTFVGRAAFHPFNLAVLQDKIKVRDKLDVYAGFTGYFGPSLDGYDPDWGIREYLGMRWHFIPKMSLFVEDCAGFGWLDGGISFNF